MDIEKRIEEITRELKELLLMQVSANEKGADMKYKGKTIKLRADGRWHTRYYNDGKQISVYGKTQKECLDKLKQALKECKNDKSNNKSTHLTLEGWINQWIELFKVNKIRQSTMYDLKTRLNKYVLSSPIAKMKVNKITAIDIQSLLNQIQAPRMREHIYTYLKDCFTKALKLNLIKQDLFIVINLPKREKKKGHSLTHEEEQKFKEACSISDIGDYYKFILATGMRKGEARAITIEDIDFNKKTITINKSLSKANELGAPKAGNRTIPLFADAEDIARKYVGSKGRLFTFGANKAQIHFRKIMDSIGLNNVTIHDLRHTFCTRCMELGIPVEQTKEWAGHSDIAITQAYYIHINKEFEQKNIDKKNKGV